MKTPPGFDATLDERFPEAPQIVEEKRMLRNSAELLHSGVKSLRDWRERMRERARDQWDPED